MIPISRCKEALTYRQAEALLDDSIRKENDSSRYAVRNILASGFDDYLKQTPVPDHTRKVVYTLMKCGTGELGYTLNVCPDCGAIQMSADKCGSRYCTACGYLKQLRWVEQRKAELIEGIPYFHVVFTVPHELNALIFQNQKLLLGHLFRSVNSTVLELSAEKKKMVPGIVMVLHTFGSSMLLHYHIHMLVSGGGLSPDKKKFVIPSSKNFFLPVKLLSARYRSIFLDGLKKLHDKGELEYFGDAQKYRNSYEWKELLDTCYKTDWNVEIRKYISPDSEESGEPNAAEHFSRYANRNSITPDRIHDAEKAKSADSPGTETAIDYLSRYTNRSAILDSRIRSYDENEVSFDYKDYRNGGEKKVMTLSVHEFIRRFLLHILPEGVAKIRYGGFLVGCVKAKNLALIRELLKQKAPENPTKEMNASELMEYFFGEALYLCPYCLAEMKNEGHRMKKPDAVHAIQV